MVVVVFHFMAMLYPNLVPGFTDHPAVIADTPLGILWNGPFAVFVFFSLSGFVIAGSAARRRDQFFSNSLARYFRLAIPMLFSILIAYGWLLIFPNATSIYMSTLESPSRWLLYTQQAPLPPILEVFYEGAVGSFISGSSELNNVLWTMQIELLGSLSLFFIYWLSGSSNICLLALFLVFSYFGLEFLGVAYLCFVFGALLYEAERHRALDRTPTWLPATTLFIGVMIGAPGPGFVDRVGLEALPAWLHLGNDRGLVPVIASILILFSVMKFSLLARAFSGRASQWLGRLSFSLYLVHVPILYTIVAWERITFDLPLFTIFCLYFIISIFLSIFFYYAIDRPTLRLITFVRKRN